MADYISREVALEFLIPTDDLNISQQDQRIVGDRFEDFLKSIPAADVRPVVKAEWVECDWCVPSHGFVEHYKNAAWKCTNCKHAFKKQDLFVRNFCPGCGADMREVNND